MTRLLESWLTMNIGIVVSACHPSLETLKPSFAKMKGCSSFTVTAFHQFFSFGSNFLCFQTPFRVTNKLYQLCLHLRMACLSFSARFVPKPSIHSLVGNIELLGFDLYDPAWFNFSSLCLILNRFNNCLLELRAIGLIFPQLFTISLI